MVTVSVVACSAPTDAAPSTRHSEAKGQSTALRPSVASEPTTAPGPSPSERAVGRDRVTLAFGGDIHFEGAARGVLRNPAPLKAALKGTVGRADFAVANLETAIGEGGQPMPGKQFTFEAPASAITVLAEAGFDAVSMANNHATDFGDAVLAQTLRAQANSPIPVFGIGQDADEAFRPVTVNLQGVRVALLGSSQVRDLTGLEHAAGASSAGIAANIEPERLRAAVRAAAASHDVVVVVMHWGTEGVTCADDRQRATAKALADDGADIIVGGHGHRPQGSGWQGSSYIGYGLGNFVWYHNDGASGESGVLNLTLDTHYATTTTRATDDRGLAPRRRSVVTSADWVPMLIGSDGVPRQAAVQRATTMSRAWQQSAACGGLSIERPG